MISAEQLVALAKEAADLTNVSDYVTDATWLQWINTASVELHRYVTNKFKATYYRTYDFTFAAGTSQLTLPPDFWRLKGLDLNPGTPQRRAVRPYNFQERNTFRQNDVRNFDPLLWTSDRWYNVIGSSFLQIQPQENAAGNYRLYYVPKPKPLAYIRTIVRTSPGDSITAATSTLFFANGLFTWADVGNVITVALATNTVNNGTYIGLQVTGTTLFKYQVPAIENRTPVNETFPAPMTATITSMLDAELEPFAEYVWLVAAIKSLAKEESPLQLKMLTDQRNLIREDLTEALETDQGGPTTIVDTDEWGDDW